MKAKAQKMYSVNDDNKITISPYARVLPLNKTQIQILREDKGTYIVLTASDLGTLQYLIEMLNQGIDRDQFTELLEKLGVKDPVAWIDLCKRKGMIE